MKLRLLMFFLFLTNDIFCQENGTIVMELNSANDIPNLLPYLASFTDTTKLVKYNSILGLYKQKHFKKEIDNSLNFGIGDYNHWIGFEIRNLSSIPIELVLDADIGTMDIIEWAIFKDSALVKQFSYDGWKTFYGFRALPSRTQSIDFQLDTHITYTCFLKVNRKIGTTVVLLDLFNKKDFYQKSLNQLIFILFFVGSIFLLSFIGLGLYIFSFQKLYLAFFFHSIFYAITLLHRFGIINMFYYSEPPLWIGPHASILSGALWAASTIFFVISFLPVKKFTSPIFLQIGYFFIIISLLIFWFCINNLLTKNQYYLFYLVMMIFITYIFLLTFIGIYKKNINAKILLFGMSFLLVGVFSILIGLITKSSNKYTLYILVIGAFFEIAVFTVVILYQFMGFQKNNINLISNLNKVQNDLIHSQETERKRIAQDLHDDLGGTLSAIKGKVSNETQNPDTLNLIEKAIEDLRGISRNLLPPELNKKGLSKAIQQSIERLQNSKNVNFTFICFGIEHKLSEEKELNIYRVVSELLNNIVKHSKASKSTIQLIYYDNYLTILIEDNGIGIKNNEKDLGIGLKNVNSRIEFLKASLVVDTSNYGSTFTIKIPFS